MPDNLGGRKAVVAPVGFERALAGSTRSRRSGFCCFCISNSFHVFFMFFSRIVGSGTPRRSQQAARGRFGRPWKFPGAHSGPVRGVPRPLGTAVCGNLFLRLASWKAFAKNTVIVGSPGASAPSGRRPARLGSRRVFFFSATASVWRPVWSHRALLFVLLQARSSFDARFGHFCTGSVFTRET